MAEPYRALQQAPRGHWRLTRRLRLHKFGAMAGQLSEIPEIETFIASPKELIALAAILAEAGKTTLAATYFDLAQKRDPGIFTRYRYLGLTHAISELRPNIARGYAADVAAADYFLQWAGTFANLLTKHKGDICVVGNSPCELGRQQGEKIDAHSLVIRFNNFSDHPRFRIDYGKKTDIWVRTPSYVYMYRRPGFRPRLTLCPSPVFWRWVNAQDLAIEYKRHELAIEDVPVAVFADLVAEFGAFPSAGITILAWIHSILGSLNGVSAYGFKLVDQLNGLKHYYTDLKRARLPSHEWSAEKRYLDRILNGQSTSLTES